MRSSFLKCLGSEGLGILEALIGASVVSITMAALMQFVGNQTKEMQGLRALGERDALVNRLGRISGDALSLNRSALAAINQAPSQFRDCVLGGATANACDSTLGIREFTLFDSNGNKVAGPPGNPQYYDLTGVSCTPSGPTDNRCAIQAISQYLPACPNGLPQCQIGKTVTVTYTVQQRPGVVLAAGPSMKPATNTVLSGLPLLLTTAGTPGTIAKWITNNQLGNSVIVENAGKLGVGTAAPGVELHVVGNGMFMPGGAETAGFISIAGQGDGVRYGSLVMADNSLTQVWGLQHLVNGHFLIGRNTGPAGSIDIEPTASNVGIGVAGTPAYRLTVGAGGFNTVDPISVAGTTVCWSSGCTATSDRRLKENVKPLEDPVSALLTLQGVTFEWKDKKRFEAGSQIGVIAQDVEKVYPQLIKTDPKSGFKSVAYGQLVSPLIEGFKVLIVRLTGLERRVADREAEIERLKHENVSLKAEVAAIKKFLCQKDLRSATCR